MKNRHRIASLVLLAIAAAPVLGAQTAEQVLNHVRDAVRYEELSGSEEVHVLKGRAEVMAEGGRWSLAFDGSGHFAETVSGRLPFSRGYDGETCWRRDWTDTPNRMQLLDRELTLVRAWFLTHFWLSDEAPLQVDVLEAGEGAVQLKWRLDGSQLDGTLAIDAETWLPVRMRVENGDDSETLEFDEFGDRLGFVHPTAWRLVNSTGLAQTYTSKTASRSEDASIFAPDLSSPEDTRFDATISPRLESRRGPGGHVLVKGLIAGREEWFIFDTGAGTMCIDAKFADEVGLDRFGRIVASGIGGKTTTAFRAGEDLQLGAMTYEQPVFMELELDFLTGAMGTRVAGIVGYELLQRAVAEVDVVDGTVALHDPSRLKLDDALWEELMIHSRHPCVRARFEGEREEWFKIDTGAGGTVSFHAPAVSRLNLLEGRETSSSSAGGVGGRVSTRSGSIEYFELGGHTFDAPHVEFALEAVGAFSDEFTTGNIGAAFLRPFRLFFDYPNRRIQFVPRDADAR